MKKTLIILTIILVLICSTTILFSGCSLAAKAMGKTYISYVQSSRFAAGNMEGDTDFEDILIDWYGGSVYISQYDGDKLVIKETANQELSDDMLLRWALFDSSDYGKYYSIKYCKKGMWDLKTIRKDLVILIPKSMEKLNKLSITCKGESSINIYLPDIDVVGDAYGGEYNVHLDAEYGNINALFKNVDSLRMIGDGEKEANKRYRRVSAQTIGSLDFVNSYAKVYFRVKEITNRAEIKAFAGDIVFECEENIKKLTTSNTNGHTFINTKNFNKLDMTSKTGQIGVEMHYLQKFQVTMSNYTEYGANDAYKEPQFKGMIGFDEDTGEVAEDAITHSGDTWTVLDGKDKFGRINEVKVLMYILVHGNL